MSADPIDTLLDEPVFADPWPEAVFIAAVDACLDVLLARFPRYADFVRDRTGGISPRPIETMERIAALPPLFLPVLKGFRFELPGDVQTAVELTSSGTTGAASVVPLDEPSMRRRVDAMAAVYGGLGIGADDIQALAFLMDPATTRMAGSVVIDAVLRAMPQVHSIQYLARQRNGKPDFSLPEAIEAVTEAASQGPVLLVGYPALIAAAVHGMRETGAGRLPLPQGSFVLTGGGWKSSLPGVQLDQGEFRRLVADFFEIGPRAVRDMFGLSECPAVFVQCDRGHYHAPVFVHAQAIDPESGEEEEPGKTGLLQLTTPLTTSYPLLKILTTDKVVINRGCDCGLATPYIVPRGRASVARFETCAMKIGQAVG
ncbi:MAG: hypothetical protein HQ581_17055 [Planctomycetes bacterium]|nr:hypothetical protein [Planctomycetota bacterium]